MLAGLPHVPVVSEFKVLPLYLLMQDDIHFRERRDEACLGHRSPDLLLLTFSAMRRALLQAIYLRFECTAVCELYPRHSSLQ